MPSIITIPTPCHENWSTMIPNDNGRHCNSCVKTVVDFTSWQPQEILQHFKANKNVCGRFTVNQLNEPIPISIPTQEDFVKQIAYFKMSTLKKVAAIFLFAFMIGASSCNENSVTNTKDETIGKIINKADTNKNVTPIDSVEVLAGLVSIAPTVNVTPVKPIPKPHVTAPSNIERHMIMGEPAMIEQPQIIGDTILKSNTDKPKECKPMQTPESQLIMGKFRVTSADIPISK